MQNPYSNAPDEQAGEFFRLALAFLSKHQIPPTPVNYQLAYDYISGKNKQLTTMLDDYIGESPVVSAESLWHVYQTFYKLDIANLEKMRQELRHLIANIQNEFKRSGGTITGFSNRLDTFASVLDSETNPEIISSEVDSMVNDTHSAAQSQKQFNSQMSDIMEEVGALRKEIEQIKEESLTDALTGISNRRAFDQLLEKSIESATNQKSPLSLLLIDIDHFKRFNDNFGHLVGDKVLWFLGKTLKRCIKGRDIAARFGGEEFAVILPHTSHVGAKVIAEMIRKSISAIELQDKEKGKSYGKITASIGVSEYLPGEASSTLIHRCDQGLYQAKKQGRNRVIVS